MSYDKKRYIFDSKKFKRQERKVINLLAKSWNEFLKLPEQHPSDAQEFMAAIHICQRTVGVRPIRKVFKEKR